jgi:toluene monooxygenase system protein E
MTDASRRTWWHLQDLGRKPRDYDITTSRLLYWPARGFEVPTRPAAWMARHQGGSPLRCRDWEAFRDPRETTYASYVALMRDREVVVDALLESAEERGWDRDLPADWVRTLDRVLAPLRFPAHGLQMVAAYVGHLSPSSRIVAAAAFQMGDELRRVQRIAQRTRLLAVHHPGFGDTARATWEGDPIWQPMRELVERLLVCWDWGEALVVSNLLVGPAFDHLFLEVLAESSREAGDEVLPHLLASLDQDGRWHRAWTRALVQLAVADEPANAAVVASWAEQWLPRVSAAVAPFEAVLGAGIAARVGLAVADAVSIEVGS